MIDVRFSNKLQWQNAIECVNVSPRNMVSQKHVVRCIILWRFTEYNSDNVKTLKKPSTPPFTQRCSGFFFSERPADGDNQYTEQYVAQYTKNAIGDNKGVSFLQMLC